MCSEFVVRSGDFQDNVTNSKPLHSNFSLENIFSRIYILAIRKLGFMREINLDQAQSRHCMQTTMQQNTYHFVNPMMPKRLQTL